jgi:hypothetical protein
MKKLTAWLLSLVLALGLSACGGADVPAESVTAAPAPAASGTAAETPRTMEPSTGDMEILRALEYGFVPAEMQGDWDKPVMYGQFCAMLGSMATLADSSLADKWGAFTAGLPDGEITRQEAMLACLLAGQLMGLTEAKDYAAEQQIGELDGVDMSSALYPAWNQSVSISTDGNGDWDNYIMAGIFYGMRQVSLVSRLPLFPPDNGEPGLQETLTREQAIHAVVRLYESQRPVARAAEKVYAGQLQAYIEQLQDDPDIAGIIAAEDERRDAILSSPTEIEKSDVFTPGQTYTGAAYYVSADGDDKADGASSETAWATLGKVNDAKLRAGDAVFFERGGIWRGHLVCADGVTYSAYGEGDKPRIYGSPENGAGEDKWSLLDGTDNIWVYYMDMYDTGGIVFNDGEDWASRRVGFWDGEKYVDPADRTTPIDIRTLQNLEMYSEVDYSGLSSEEARFEQLRQGKLYLRCDAGNPGEVYHSIEFLSQSDALGLEFAVQGGDGTVIDNLCVMYTSASGIYLPGNAVVQNCEAGWVGGAVMNFGDFGGTGVLRVGDGISAGRGPNAAGVNNTILNNYVHHCYDQAVAIEMGHGYDESLHYAQNLTVKGNVTERTSGGITVTDWASLNEGWENGLLYKDVFIEDNYVMYSGFGWSHLSADFDWGEPGPVNNGNTSIMFGFAPNAGENIQVNNNVLCLSCYALVSGKFGEQAQPYDASFSGNTYVQQDGGMLAEWTSPEDGGVVGAYYDHGDAKQTIGDILNDASAVVYSTKQPV